MKPIKFLLSVLLGAVYASAWWGAAVFGRTVDTFGLWLLPGAATLVLGILSASWIADHWKESQ